MGKQAERDSQETVGQHTCGRSSTPTGRQAGQKAMGCQARHQAGAKTVGRQAAAPPGRGRVIAHLVLFRPKRGLTDAQRAALVNALEEALNSIPVIKRARVGRRKTLGRFYDAQNADDYPFAAILEFDGESDLVAYLEHPAHRSLGEQFYLTSDRALAMDFELLEGDELARLLS